jgi:hypothetical protein
VEARTQSSDDLRSFGLRADCWQTRPQNVNLVQDDRTQSRLALDCLLVDGRQVLSHTKYDSIVICLPLLYSPRLVVRWTRLTPQADSQPVRGVELARLLHDVDDCFAIGDFREAVPKYFDQRVF